MFRTVRGDCQAPQTGWDKTGRLSVVRRGRPKGRVGDCRRRPGVVRGSGGLLSEVVV